jgi:hypothetical protein
MYRPPMNLRIEHLEATRRAPEREVEVLRRLHREHVAAVRAKARDERQPSLTGARRIARPAAAIWALVFMRR